MDSKAKSDLFDMNKSAAHGAIKQARENLREDALRTAESDRRTVRDFEYACEVIEGALVLSLATDGAESEAPGLEKLRACIARECLAFVASSRYLNANASTLGSAVQS